MRIHVSLLRCIYHELITFFAKAKREIRHTYPKVTSVGNVVEILDVLLMSKIAQNVYISIGSFIVRKDVMIGNKHYLFTVPNLRIIQNISYVQFNG